MLHFLNMNIKNIIFLLALTLFATSCFQKNFMNFSNQVFFYDFQRDSESLVVGAIVSDKLGLDKKGANLVKISKDNNFYYGYDLLANEQLSENIVSNPYLSQYGIQGLVFSKINSLFGFRKVAMLQCINSISLAIVIISLFFLYRKIYDHRFAAIFLITMISSPWIVSFASNLYWVSFLWFLPALLAAIIYLNKGRIFRLLSLLGIGVAVFIKSLAGYEYLSTITLFTCSVFVVAPFFKSSNRDLSGNLRMFFFVFIACVIGFFCALLVHANMRGDSILTGLQNILDQDIKRRTYGDPALFDPSYKESLKSSPLTVINTYVMDWRTPLVLWLPGYLFKVLLIFAVIGVLYKYSIKHITRQKDTALLVFFFIVPVSWFVLAKGHSYQHTHMNYVLWYFGFVQALIYVSFNTTIILCLDFFKWAKTIDAKDF
ncbi:MAG: hypothetical protein RIQ94_898 [Pseudomonadota bacterium]|jgi:hypothetical protein